MFSLTMRSISTPVPSSSSSWATAAGPANAPAVSATVAAITVSRVARLRTKVIAIGEPPLSSSCLGGSSSRCQSDNVVWNGSPGRSRCQPVSGLFRCNRCHIVRAMAQRDRTTLSAAEAESAPHRRRATMRDVAALAGVSIKTVSRVVNARARRLGRPGRARGGCRHAAGLPPGPDRLQPAPRAPDGHAGPDARERRQPLLRRRPPGRRRCRHRARHGRAGHQPRRGPGARARGGTDHDPATRRRPGHRAHRHGPVLPAP